MDSHLTPADVCYRRGARRVGSGEVYAPCVARRVGEEVVPLVFWEKERTAMKNKDGLPPVSFTQAKDSFFDSKKVMDALSENPEDRNKRWKENAEKVLSEVPGALPQAVVTVPDSVHGFWWKAARWEVFLLLFLAVSFLAAQYFPNDFVTAFCLQFGLLTAQLLLSLCVPAVFRLYAGKQSSIAVSTVFACIAALVFNMFNVWMYDGSVPQGSPLMILDFILTVSAGYKIVRREVGIRFEGFHSQKWRRVVAMIAVGVIVAMCSCRYIGFGRLKTTGCVIFGLAAGGSFFYVSRFVEDSFKKASAGYRRDDPGKALAYAAMGLLCLLVWIGMLAGMYSVLRNLRW